MSTQPTDERTYLDEDGRPVEFHEYPEGADVREATIRRDDDDELAVTVLFESGETAEFEFEPLQEMFIGLEPKGDSAEDIPQDVLSALFDFGYTVTEGDNGE